VADDTLKRDMGYLLGQTSRWLRALLAEELRFHGLDDACYIVLYFANDAGEGGVGTKALAGRIEMDFAEVEATAKRLVRDGWLTESLDPADRDSRLIRMTPKALSVLPVLTDAAHWAIERALNGFTHEEIARLTAYLHRMQANLR
jgi:DNA-binding MarR family transcriptional regulator